MTDDKDERAGIARDAYLLVLTLAVFLVLFAGAVLAWLPAQ
ncbi:MAG: hypothetical protein ACRDYU_13300 [Actinomycetes bacterium]